MLSEGELLIVGKEKKGQVRSGSEREEKKNAG